MSIDKFGTFFKPETQKSGQDYFNKNAVFISSGSDTQIQAYVRTSTSFKVTLTARDIADASFSADCSCPASAKGTYCKHIWATLLMVAKKYPDFLDSKNNIERPSESVPSPAQLRAEQHRLQQKTYRKQQYQKQKQRLKELKQEKENGPLLKNIPESVQKAMQFFSENGFPMDNSFNEFDLNTARKKLSRVFHPDIGGSHNEVLVLNENFKTLERFLRLRNSSADPAT
jgi:hypothetical protein